LSVDVVIAAVVGSPKSIRLFLAKASGNRIIYNQKKNNNSGIKGEKTENMEINIEKRFGDIFVS
jgi:hypothetical protein